MSFEHIDTFGSTVSIDGTVIHGIDPGTVPFPKGSTGSKNTSTLDSGTVMQKGLNMYDPGTVDISGNMIPSDAGQIAMWAAFGDRKLHTFSISIPDAGEIFSYEAYVTKFEPGSEENTYVWTATLDVSGVASRATTYAGITSITASGAGVVQTPAVLGTGNVLVVNEANGITTATLTVVAASADYIAYSLNNGSTWTAMTTGEASSAISLTAGVIKEVLLQVEEDEKATRFVKIIMIQAAA